MFDDFRVYLRALELDDYKTSINWRKDDEIWDMIGGPKYYVSEAYEKKWVEDRIFHSPNQITLAVCLKENDQYIGNAYLADIDWVNRSAQSGILIGEKQYWNQGLAFEASILRLYYAFYEKGLNSIWSEILESNIASQKMSEKAGYKKVGVLRQAVYKNGKYQNLVIISLIRDDFDKFIKNYEKV